MASEPEKAAMIKDLYRVEGKAELIGGMIVPVLGPWVDFRAESLHGSVRSLDDLGRGSKGPCWQSLHGRHRGRH